jgi:hypothetical protein
MRLIYEENIEDSDFLEFILTPKEFEALLEKGVVDDFPGGLQGNRNLNVFIRVEVDKITGAVHAIEAREEPSCDLGKYKGNGRVGPSTKTSRCRSADKG